MPETCGRIPLAGQGNPDGRGGFQVSHFPMRATASCISATERA